MKVTFVLDNVRSAFNVGSIFRTADGLGFEINLIGLSPSPLKDKKIEKTSLNSIPYVKWRYFENFEEWSKNIHDSLIISVEENNRESINFFDVNKIDFKKYKQIFIIFGHEINGVSEKFLDVSKYVIKIPMYGTKNSLNVATCAGIIGYKIKENIL